MLSSKLPLVIGSIFTLMGLGIFYFGAREYFQTKNFLKIARQAIGEVTDFDVNISTEDVKDSEGNDRGTTSSTAYYPKIRFTTQSGKEVEFVAKTGSSESDVKIGDKVTILYNPENPRYAYRNEWWDLWFGVVVMTSLGAIFIICGISAIIFFPNPVFNFLRKYNR